MKKILFLVALLAGSAFLLLPTCSVPTAEAQASQALNASALFQYIPSEMLRPMQKDYNIVFVDVRGHTSYKEEHITGALDVPLMEMRRGNMKQILALDRTTFLVTYCGCPHAMAEEAAEILVKKGFATVAVLDDGYYGWKDLGYPVTGLQHEPAPKAPGTPGKPQSRTPFKKLLLQGQVDAELVGQKIEVHDYSTGQMELGTVGEKGQFELHMPYYGNPENLHLDYRVAQQHWSRRFVDGQRINLQ